SRRRHTRFSRDWSSDVCSSDLGYEAQKGQYDNFTAYKLGMPNDLPSMRQGDISNIANTGVKGWNSLISSFARAIYNYDDRYLVRSEERRVGKEYRSEWSREYEK